MAHRGNSRRITRYSVNWRLCLVAALLSLSFYCILFSPLRILSTTHAAPTDVTAVSTATREGRLAVFDDAWSTINDRYYDRSFHGLDWEAQRTAFRSLAAEANSGQELYAVLRRMIAYLNDPHTRIFAPEEKFDWWHPRFVSIGMAIREIGGLPTVVQVDRGSAPQRAGIRVGDVIETVNGEPALSLINSRFAGSLPSASAASRFRAFATMLEGPPETLVEVGWKTRNGNERTVQFRRYWQQRDLGLRVYQEGNYAVIEIDAFTGAIAADFARELKEKTGRARGLILDLRSNGGGDAEAMADVASAFLGEGLSLGQFTDRSGQTFTISTHLKSPLAPELTAQTRLPLVVLTSERTSSAAEIFVAALRASKRAIVIGTETCGCVLAIRTRHVLPDGGLLDVSELDYQTPAGDRLEGHGLRPDESVRVARDDLYSGHDRAMELALRELKRLML